MWVSWSSCSVTRTPRCLPLGIWNITVGRGLPLGCRRHGLWLLAVSLRCARHAGYATRRHVTALQFSSSCTWQHHVSCNRSLDKAQGRRAGGSSDLWSEGTEGPLSVGRNWRALWRASGKPEVAQNIWGAQVQSLKGVAGWGKAAETGGLRPESRVCINLIFTWWNKEATEGF